MPRVAIVTGASSGIGHATARALADRGWVVYAGARRVERMQDLAARGILAVRLDVTDDAEAEAVVDRAIAEHGRIDALVNNAGYGAYGALEDVPLEDGERQLDVNVVGVARMTRLVLPHMRARRYGRIVNVSSIGGRMVMPFGSWYHASKFAIEGMSGALRMEVAPFGVKVIVIEPGGIQTEWGGIARQSGVEASADGPYGPAVERALSIFGRGESAGSPPEAVARIIVRSIESRHPRHSYAAAGGAPVILGVRRVLPNRVFDGIIRRAVVGSGDRRPTTDRGVYAGDRPRGTTMGNETDPGETGADDTEVTEKSDGVGGDGTIPGDPDGIAAGVTKTASTFEPEEDEAAPA